MPKGYSEEELRQQERELEAAIMAEADTVLSTPPAQMPLDEQEKLALADPDRIEDGADVHQQQRPMTREEARRMAAEINQEYYALPRPLRPLVASSPLVEDELQRIKKKSIRRLQNLGGGLAYWATRPIQHLITRPLAANMAHYSGDEESYFRLLQASEVPASPETKEDMPSNDQHDQLDDAIAFGQQPKESWLDRDPVRWAQRMAGDVNAEDFLIMGQFGGDREAYHKWMSQQNLFTRAAINTGHVIEDLTMPDPMMAVGEATKVLKLPFDAAKALRMGKVAKALDVPVKELKGALETYNIVRKGRIGELERHIGGLEKALDTADEGSMEAARLQRRVWEAKRELARRNAASAEPELGIYTVGRRDPKTVYQPMEHMDVDEVAARQGAADAHASYGEVDASLKEQGFENVQDMHRRVAEAHDALASKTETATHMSDLNALDRLPDNVKASLDELGISSARVRRAAALTRSRGFEGEFIRGVNDPEAMAQMAFNGLDDSQEAALGIAHMRDGGQAADLGLHGVEVPELANPIHVDVDGIVLRETPDYHAITDASGIRNMSKSEALQHLLGRYTTAGLAAGSLNLDSGALTRVANKVGHTLKFGVGRYMPLSVRSFVPEIADIHKRATRLYGTFQNEGQEFLRESLLRSGLAAEKKGAVVARDAAKLDHVLEMLDTPLDMAGRSARLDELMAKAGSEETQLYHDIRTWLDAWVVRLNLGEKGQAISGYFPHLFEKEGNKTNARILEFIGSNPKAYKTYWMLKNRVANAEGWNRDLIHVMDLYNRGVSRALVMEPAFTEMEKVIEGYRAAGQMDMVKYGTKFVNDARGLGGPSWVTQLADHLELSPGTRNAVEWTTRQLTGLTYKGLLGGNLNFMIQNMAGGLTNMAAEHGPLGLIQGIVNLATKEGRAAAEASGIFKEGLMTLENMPKNAKWLDQAYNVMDVGSRTEHFLRGLAVNVALQEQLKAAGKTWQEVRAAGMEMTYLRDAVETAERTQHEFGVLGRSPYLHSALGHTGYHAFVQLGTYPYKQMEFLLRSMSKDPGFIVKYLAHSGIAARMGAEAGGVALGPSTGFGFMGPIARPRKNRPVPLSPSFEILASMVDFGVAMRSQDPREVVSKREALWRAAEAALPLGNTFIRAARNMREALAGETERFNEQAPIGEVMGQLMSGNPEIKHAERKLTTTQERVAHALGLQTVADRAQQVSKDFERQKKFNRQRVRMEAVESRKHRISQYEDALSDYDKALQKGDFDSAHMIYNNAATKGVMNFSGVGEQAGREARFLRARLQFLKNAPGFLPIEEEPE